MATAASTADGGLPPLPAPQSLDCFARQFDQENRIGEGGYGQIYEITDKKDGSKWIAKVVNLMTKGDERESLQKRTLTEIQIFYAVQGQDLKSGHENILKFYKWYLKPSTIPKQADIIVSVLEKCYSDLHDRMYVQLKRALLETEAQPVIREVAQALRYLHARNICHRDIKLENILCAHPTNLTPIKLCDFNCSRYLGPTTPPSPMKDSLGTKSMMDPQRLTMRLYPNTEVPYSRKCDSWSLGQVLYQLLTTYTLFQDRSHCDKRHCAAQKDGPFGTKIYVPRDYLKCKDCANLNMTMRCHQRFFPIEVRNHSRQCENLLNHLLSIKEENRLNMDEVLQHHWFRMT